MTCLFRGPSLHLSWSVLTLGTLTGLCTPPYVCQGIYDVLVYGLDILETAENYCSTHSLQ